MQGGSYLLLEVDSKPIVKEKLQNKLLLLRKILKENNIKYKSIKIQDESITFEMTKEKIGDFESFFRQDGFHTSIKLTKIGNNWKSFYTINWLAKQAVPSGSENKDAPGNSAGFMFWETVEGFHFKSIDGLMNTEKNKIKRKFIYNETSEGPCSGEMPEGYDAKVLEMTVDNRVNVQEKLKMGAYSTRLITFNPFNTYYEVVTPNAGNAKGAAETG